MYGALTFKKLLEREKRAAPLIILLLTRFSSDSLRKLELQRNNLSSLRPGVFDKLTSLDSLHLRRNGLTCLPYLRPSID